MSKRTVRDRLKDDPFPERANGEMKATTKPTMVTQSKWEAIPNVEEQTQLDDPIKIRWSGQDRSRVRRGLVSLLESGDVERAIALPAMARQKTQVVIKTEEELESLRQELEWKAKWRVQRRIEDEIDAQLNGEDTEEEESHSEAYLMRKEETDMDVLMEEIVKPHARKKVSEVWNDTIDFEKITWFWNPFLTSSTGMAYWGSAVPDYANNEGPRIAIGLADGYYYQHGVDELLAVVRHELIHIWQAEHPAGDRIGHGPKFKQWLDDMDTHRYCNHW